MQMMEATTKYNTYIESEREFSYILRMEYEWYDQEYQEMISLVRDVFREYKEEDVLPKSIIYFFTGIIDSIVGIVSNEVFFTTTPERFTKEEYESLVLRRKSELLELKELFFLGDFSKLSSHSFFL